MGASGYPPVALLPGTILPAPQTTQGVAPSSSSGPTDAEDFLRSLSQQRAALEQQTQALVTRGLTPQSSMGPGTSPELWQNPIQPFQPAQTPQRQVVGRRAQRQQNLSQIITAAANAVGRITTARAQQKQRVLAVDLQRVFQSVDGIQQAKDVMNDPNASPQQKQNAQKSMQDNIQIMNDILSDDSKRKQISKALDISFTDPSSNSGPEHNALKQASQSYAQQLMNRVPQQMQINPLAIQRLQLLQGQEAGIDRLAGQIIPTMMREQGMNERQQYHETEEDQRTQAKMQNDYNRTMAEVQGRYQTAMQTAKTREEGAWARAQFNAEQSFARLNYGLNRREYLIEHRDLQPQQKISAYQRSLGIAAAASSRMGTEINSMKELRDQLQNNEPDNPQIQKYNETIKNLENQMEKLTEFQTDTMNKIQKLQSGGNSSNGQSTSGSSVGSNGAPTVGQEQDDSDEDDSDIYGISQDNQEQ